MDREHAEVAVSAALRKCRRRMLKRGKGGLEKTLIKRELFLQYQSKVERGEAKSPVRVA